jgi:glycerol-3-phosphate acyltransferase PlsX
VLEQYAVIGSVYASDVLGLENPRVALLNIGQEGSKGNAQAKVAYSLMAEAAAQGRYNFVGNVESSHILAGDVADVVVCDGFVGNIVLKLIEGLYSINAKQGLVNDFWQGLNYEHTGGTAVLGVEGGYYRSRQIDSRGC